VTEINTSVENKSVVVKADPSVSKQMMLEKLLKVSFWDQQNLFPCDPFSVFFSQPDSHHFCILHSGLMLAISLLRLYHRICLASLTNIIILIVRTYAREFKISSLFLLVICPAIKKDI
jgi:hypothetical protein